jgi:RimJ/RimL family protein N-acetyltransferase
MIDFNLGVKLDAISEDELDQMRLWRNERSVNKWCRQTGLISPLSQKEWYVRQNADPSINMFIVKKLIGTPIGVCGLTSIDFFNRRAEFSLYIGKAYNNLYL